MDTPITSFTVADIPIMGYGCGEMAYLVNGYAPPRESERFIAVFPDCLQETAAFAFGLSTLIARGQIDVASEDLSPTGLTGEISLSFQNSHSWILLTGQRRGFEDGITLVISSTRVTAIQHREYGTSYVRVVNISHDPWEGAIAFAQEFHALCDPHSVDVLIQHQIPALVLPKFISKNNR